MKVYEAIRTARRRVIIGIVAGYVVALAATVLRLANTDPLTTGEIAGSVALGAALAVPPLLATLSLDRRPTLLPAATLAALAAGVVVPWFLPIWAGVAYLWHLAARDRVVRADAGGWLRAARWLAPIAVFGAMLALFMHTDPRCWAERADGTRVEIDAEARGFESGWEVGSGTTASSSSLQPDGTTETCSSNVVVGAEAALSLAISGGIVVAGLRWPRGVRPAEDRR